MAAAGRPHVVKKDSTNMSAPFSASGGAETAWRGSHHRPSTPTQTDSQNQSREGPKSAPNVRHYNLRTPQQPARADVISKCIAGPGLIEGQTKRKLCFEDAGPDLTIDDAKGFLTFRKGSFKGRIRLSPSSKLETAEDAEHSIASDVAWESHLQRNIRFVCALKAAVPLSLHAEWLISLLRMNRIQMCLAIYA